MSTEIDISLLVGLTEVLFPPTMYKNPFGVYCGEFGLLIDSPKLRVDIDLGSINGIWGSSPSASSSTHGFGVPFTRDDFKYSSLSEAARDSFFKAVDYFERHGNDTLPLRKKFEKWDKLSEEEKLKTLYVKEIFLRESFI